MEANRRHLRCQTTGGRCHLKLVEWEDGDGWKRLSLLREEDPDELAGKIGIPADPPDVRELDWEAVARELNNILVRDRLINWKSVQRSQNGVTTAILHCGLRKMLIQLYRQEESL